MPRQLNSDYDEVRVPFNAMSFTPDVPSTNLGPNEYNDGLNVESDVRGIRSVAGDIDILETVPGTPTFITGGFRQNNEFWFVVATVEGNYYAGNGTELTALGPGTYWYDITPSGGVGTYAQNTNITEAWNGTVLFLNDSQNPPMFWPEATNLVPYPILTMYKGLIEEAEINAIGVAIPLNNLVTYSIPVDTYTYPPYGNGDQVIVSGVNKFFDGIYTVESSSLGSIVLYQIPGGAAPSPVPPSATISPLYNWNYNPNWNNYYANFMRLYSTPNVGSILVAGNLTATPALTIIGDTNTGSNVIPTTNATSTMLNANIYGEGIPIGTIVTNVTPGIDLTISQNATLTQTGINIKLGLDDKLLYPVTVQWSQAFGLNEAPITWQPTITNVANQLEVPLRGPALDAFPCNGQFFICSYWDTVVLSPLNYATTSAPILGVRLYNQGRGLLSSNCWGNTDKLVYGVDARDIWVFDGTDFTGLGNQKVKNWFFDQLDPQYYDRVHMEVNTQKNQVEIYYPDINAIEGVPNKMISYRYDLQLWNAPRDVTNATFACESPIWTDNKTYYEVSGTTSGSGINATFNVSWDLTAGTTYSVIVADKGTGYAINDTITILGTDLGGTSPTNDLVITVDMISVGGKIELISNTGVSAPKWQANLGSRGIVYARGETSQKLVQKDFGYEINNQPISSYFKRSNIKLIKDYSGKLMVHRLLPEAVNLGGIPFGPGGTYNKQLSESTGNISVRIDGANSVGQSPVETTDLTMALNTDNPWLQPDQNSHRVNTITISDTSSSNIWMCSATTWQYTQVEDDR